MENSEEGKEYNTMIRSLSVSSNAFLAAFTTQAIWAILHRL
jgi:hypothetical protein